MAHHTPADRETELKLFESMIAGQCEESILLIEAPGQMGKSTLLSTFERRCLRAGQLCALVDLKGGSVGLDELFYRICDDLDWDRFPRFWEQVAALAHPNVVVNIGKNVMFGQQQITVALKADNEADRRQRLTCLTQALFQDLRACAERLVLIFDTYQQADPLVKEWLIGPCLARARRTPNLTVVIAGRHIPPEPTECQSHCHRHFLSGVRDVRAWQSYAERRGWVIQAEWIEGFCVATQGDPYQIDMLLVGVVRSGGQS